MTKLLTNLLEAKQPLFTRALDQLEQASGRKGMDVKLTAEIIEKFHKKTKELGLDPNDTTGPELYKALINQAMKHDLHLAKQIGAKDEHDVYEIIPLAVKAINATKMPRDCWVLKDSVARKMLKNIPPQNIMKRLNYRSVDSMLKRENLYEIYGALRFAEDEDWLNKFNEQYESLKPTDFETREIKLVVMPKERWGDIAAHYIEKKRHINTHLKELGVVLILPPIQPRMSGIATKVITLTFHYYNEVRLYSAFFKAQQVKPDFGKIFVNTLIADPSEAAVMAGQQVHWRVIQRYFGKLKDEKHPEVFEPHVQPEDLHWRKAEELMCKIDPELKFWEDLDYVGVMYDDRPITFNFMDVVLSYSNEVGYDDRYVYHFKEALWNEVFMRYMGEKTLEDQILRQLDNDLINPARLAVD